MVAQKVWKLINCKINLQLKWSQKCILVAGTAVNQVPKFIISYIKLYVPVVTLSTQDNAKFLKQVESEVQVIWININLKNQIKCKTDI